MCELMRRYDETINLIIPERVFFFSATQTTCLDGSWVTRQFHINWDKANPSIDAVPYDLRHNYAIQNINSWIDKGFEFDSKLHYLCHSMGHSTIQSTLHYYSLVPYLADIIYTKTNKELDEMIPEICYEES